MIKNVFKYLILKWYKTLGILKNIKNKNLNNDLLFKEKIKKRR